MGEELVRYDVRDRIAHVTIDNGKANALSPDVIAALRGGRFRAGSTLGRMQYAPT